MIFWTPPLSCFKLLSWQETLFLFYMGRMFLSHDRTLTMYFQNHQSNFPKIFSVTESFCINCISGLCWQHVFHLMVESGCIIAPAVRRGYSQRLLATKQILCYLQYLNIWYNLFDQYLNIATFNTSIFDTIYLIKSISYKFFHDGSVLYHSLVSSPFWSPYRPRRILQNVFF